ncbi:hypothetical protein MHSWG343_02130 [Candidatus Mycoplasma haematohominis]|uniref:Uncharacterized protein n=1 Tax=Candidatus Mycoplasma haematohominis TaxID=1494318 RepID=A0A478FPC3_9MOLU|nr:hypothetical protein MHSWG343_02130 [Candidatus Mycoplasma haemohominis]
MDFFIRRKPFIFVQELSKVENTKELLVSKLTFLSKQIKLTFESIHKSELVIPQFATTSVFSLDLQVKILNSLIHLVNAGHLEWAFLTTFKVKDTRPYILGEIKGNSFILDTGRIQKESDLFFFRLLKLNILDVKSWMHLNRLSIFDECIGIGKINDSSYYSYKNELLVEPLEDLKIFQTSLNEMEKDFKVNFFGRPLLLKKPEPVLWKLLHITDELNNRDLVISTVKFNRFQYDNLRSNKSLLKLPKKQCEIFIESISKLNSFSKLYQAMEEYKLFDESGKNIAPLFKCYLEFFLSQNGLLLRSDNVDYSKYSIYEKFMNALKWLEVVLFICENDINFVPKGQESNVFKDRFVEACKIELSILLDQPSIRYIMTYSLSFVTMLLNVINQIKSTEAYKKYYVVTMNKYFENICFVG